MTNFANNYCTLVLRIVMDKVNVFKILNVNVINHTMDMIVQLKNNAKMEIWIIVTYIKL